MAATATPRVQTSYAVGWNDTEYGINHWTGGSKWAGPEEWAEEMKRLAKAHRELARTGVNRSYADGVIDCVDQYLRTKVVGRK